MTEPEPEPEPDTARTAETTNTAEGGSTVGIQAESVHNSNVYFMSPDASPDEKFRVGAKYLDDGVPGKARDLISEAIARGLDNGEVRFHWVLAMLSKRSYRDLSIQEREQLERLPELLPGYADDEWRTALATLGDILSQISDPDGDRVTRANEINALSDPQRDMIVRHLDLVLSGSTKDRLWAMTRRAAKAAQLDEDRLGRAWAYFHPDPAKPRVRALDNDAASRSEWFWSIVGSALFLAAFANSTRLALAGEPMLPAVALLLAIIACCVGAPAGVEWRFRAELLAVKDRAHANDGRSDRPIQPGLPRQVDNAFQYYAYKYAPEGADRERWINEARGIRATLRDDLIELYRHGETKTKEIHWLIRHHVAETRDQWKNGTLLDYRTRYRTPLRLKVRCLASLAVAGAAVATVVLSAVHVSLLPATLGAPVVVAGGWLAGDGWLRILSNRRKLAEERREHDELWDARRRAYERWRDKLLDKRPSERQMERWLDADKVLFIDEALRNYQLYWRDIIAYAVLQAPARSYDRARVSDGPWRYSKYQLRVFLITHRGVREVGTELDFTRAVRDRQERSTFRFDAVSSVQVKISGAAGYSLDLTLTNGPTRNIRIVDAEPDSVESPTALSQLSLDAAGFVHALHILEGIAAEGKGWIGRDGKGYR